MSELAYFKLFLDWKEKTALLSDDEKGRLIDAIVDYASGKETAALMGNEKFLFPSYSLQIDRDNETYRKKCEKLSKNQRKRWEKKSSTIEYNCMQEKEEEKEYEYEKEKEEDYCISNNPQSNEGFIPYYSINAEAERYQNTMQRLIDAAEACGIKNTQAVYDELNLLQSVHGEEAVINAIKKAALHDNRGGVSLAFVRSIIENKGGVSDRKGKVVNESKFDQRTYNNEEMNDLSPEMIELLNGGK